LLTFSGHAQSSAGLLHTGRMLEVYKMLASTKKRHFVVMDVKKNFMSASRIANVRSKMASMNLPPIHRKSRGEPGKTPSTPNLKPRRTPVPNDETENVFEGK